MALTSRKIITRAYRAVNITPIGKAPTDAEMNEGLETYQDFIFSLFGNDIGNLLEPWEAPPSPTSQYASRYPLLPATNLMNNGQVDLNVWANPPANVRLITGAGIGTPIYFPPTPSNGAQLALVNVGADFATTPLTLAGNGRLIEGATQLVISTPLTSPIRWFYRDDVATWMRLSDLTLDSASPLPEQFNDFLIASFGIYVAGMNGADVPGPVAGRAKRGHTLLKTTYLQNSPGATFPGAWRFLTYQGYGNSGFWGGGQF